MPPQRTATSFSSKRTQPAGTKNKKTTISVPEDVQLDDPFESPDEEATKRRVAAAQRQKKPAEDDEEDAQLVKDGRGGEEDEEKTIPKELLTRLLHEFFTKGATRISRDANATVGKYFDVFVREAIARTAVEKQGGFLEVCQHKASPCH
jgi:centromere protein X